VSPRFSYGSLLDKTNLGANDARLFKKLETANFETS